MSKLTVAYWHIRGLGGPLRMVCAYAKADYTPKTYEVEGKEGAFDKSCWFEAEEAKPALIKLNPLINLPYIVDGQTVVSQTNACLQYLGRKFGLGGQGDTEQVRVEQVLCEVMDLRNGSVAVFYGRDPDMGGWLSSRVHVHLAKLESWFGFVAKRFSASDSAPTVADFHLWEILDHNVECAQFWARESGKDVPSPLGQYPLLAKFYQTFRALPELEDYFKSPLYDLPINNKHARFGNVSYHKCQ